MLEMTEGASATADEMDISNALSQFLAMFNADCKQFNIYMASNCAVDWFGRSVRGPTKIQDYLRNEVCGQYQHINFKGVKSCDPIEYKPSHLKTKSLPSSDVDFTQHLNKVSGITSLKVYADSDIEDNDVHVDSMITPERPSPTSALINSSAAITPPTSTRKQQTSGFESESEHEDVMITATSAKRRKRSHSTQQYYHLHRFQSTAVKRRLINDAGMRALMLDESTDEEDGEREEQIKRRRNAEMAEFTPLKYFEVTGVLRAHNANQDAGDTHVGMRTGVTAADTPQSACWDRPVRLRVSFRRRVEDQQIQFALIIYEHPDKSAASSMLRKRNLMLEFNRSKADDDSDDVVSDDDELVEEELEGAKAAVKQQLIDTDFLISTNEEPVENPLMTTPTKLANTPPATPTRKPRLPQSLSSLKRLHAQHTIKPADATAATTPSPKRSVARSLRL